MTELARRSVEDCLQRALTTQMPVHIHTMRDTDGIEVTKDAMPPGNVVGSNRPPMVITNDGVRPTRAMPSGG